MAVLLPNGPEVKHHTRNAHNVAAATCEKEKSMNSRKWAWRDSSQALMMGGDWAGDTWLVWEKKEQAQHFVVGARWEKEGEGGDQGRKNNALQWWKPGRHHQGARNRWMKGKCG